MYTVLVCIYCRARGEDNDVRRLVQCGVERCLVHRSLDSIDLLLRCLEQRCAAVLPRGSEVEKVGKKRAMKLASDCAAACDGTVGDAYLKCVNQLCGIRERPAIVTYCQSVCEVIYPDNVEACIQRYCPVNDYQEDQGRGRNKT